MTNARRQPRRTGFTIAEMVVSLFILSILMIAMGGAITVAARALPTPTAPLNSELSLNAALDRISGELRYAKTIESSSATAVQFTVADRDNDGNDEHVRYEWLGSGTAVTRSYNGGTAVAISDPLTSFALTYQTQKITNSQSTSTVVDSGEVLFTSCTGWSGLVPIASNSTLSSTSWATCYFKPDQVSFPTVVTSVNITRVRVKIKKASSPNGATISVGIFAPASAGGPVPGTTQIGTASSVAVSTLTTSYPSTFIDFPFVDVTFGNAPTELNFVVKGTGTTCGSMQYDNNILAPANTPVFLYTSNSGTAWNPAAASRAANDGIYEVYGSYKTTATVVASTDTYYLHTFNLSANKGAVHAETSQRALNTPTVAGP